jgi:hypothetical protein
VEKREEKNKKRKMKNILTYENFSSDQIPGGLSQGKGLEDIQKKFNAKGYYDPRDFMSSLQKQLEKGVRVEMEHTTDPGIAKEISLDHLMEDPNYYDKLEKIEKNNPTHG